MMLAYYIIVYTLSMESIKSINYLGFLVHIWQKQNILCEITVKYVAA